jgi:monoamine oxidase
MITRRRLIEHIGTIGGLGAAYGAMIALGLESPASAQTTAPTLPPAFGKGVRVVILGAGICGLTAAHELERAGYYVTILEARERVGGRAWTLRDGDKIEMVGEETQTVRFSPGLYMNAGPARIPSFHQGLLGYAQKFGVPLEVEVNSSRSAYIMGEDGTRVRLRAAVNDMRGYVSEMLSKALSQGALDQSVSAADKQKLLPFLKAYGGLTPDGQFKGTQNSGFAQYPGAGVTPGKAVDPVPLDTLLANRELPLAEFEDFIYMQATMFQPVGGMDRIHAGFQRNLLRPATLGAEVIEIGQSGKGVKVAYRDKASGSVQAIEADYLICTIPFPVLAGIKTDFSPAVKRAIAGVVYDHSNKVGFDAPRFWEKEDQIYGGISFVGGETGLVWYPSANIFSPRGMLLGCYASGKLAAEFEKRPIAEQIEFSRGVIDKLHPGHGKDLINGVAVNWHKIPYNLGPWPAWNGGEGRQEEAVATAPFKLLLQPEGRVYFAGAAMSQTPGWQEGGIQSAWSVIAQIGKRALTEIPASRKAAT